MGVRLAKMRLLVVAFLLVGLFAPIATATHDPNDFWVNEQNIVPYDIHDTASSSPWALQLGGTAWQRTGEVFGVPTWQSHATGLTDNNGLGAIFALDASNVYACTAQTFTTQTVSRWGGVNFALMAAPNGAGTGFSCRAIWAFASNNVWIGGNIAGQGAVVARWDGAAWTVTDLIISDNEILDFWGFSSTNIWALGSDGNVLQYDGVSWTVKGSTGFDVSGAGSGIWGTSSTNLYAWSQNPAGMFSRSTDNGATWVSLGLTDMAIWDVSGVGATDFWVAGATVGNTASLRHSATATTFTEEDPQTTNIINAIWFTTATEGYFATFRTSTGPNPGIFRLNVLPNVALPSLTGLMLQRNDFNVEASQAQCNGDETALRVETDRTIGTGGISVWVINSDTNVVMQNWMNVQTHVDWFNLQNHLLHTSKIYPPGDYVLVGTVDVLGALEDDQFSTAPFNVPIGTCIDSIFDDTDLRAFIVERTNQTNSYVNTTSEAILENLTSVHVHIDSHFNMTDSLIVSQFFQTNGYINTSRIQILDVINDLDFNIDCGNETSGNCTFEAQTMIDLPGLTDQQVGAFLIFLVMLIISFFQRWLFVAIASVIGILEVFILGGVFGFEFTGLLLVIGIMMQIFVDHRDAMLEKKRETEGGEIGD